MLQISTNKLSQRKHVEIDGHYYVVRRMGAGDQMTMNEFMRELDKMAKDEESQPLSEEKLERIKDIERLSLELAARCFDDQEDGERAKKLVSNLSPEELNELMEQIFGKSNEQAEVS